MTQGPQEWDARTYHRVSEPQFAWGRKVLERLPLSGEETVIDAGCGSGRLTALLLERLPRGRVIALDRSENMIAQARQTLASAGDRVRFLRADLLDFQAEPADVIFSTATFHWVLDHQRLFAHLRESLRPGGRLFAQCGGAGNLHALHERAFALLAEPRFAAHAARWTDPWHFASDLETLERLTRLGYQEVRAWLEPAPVTFDGAESYRAFVEAVVLRPHLALLPDPRLRTEFLEAMVVAAGADRTPFALDYVRLNLDARRPR